MQGEELLLGQPDIIVSVQCIEGALVLVASATLTRRTATGCCTSNKTFNRPRCITYDRKIYFTLA
jgi:hypothetical protein